jgi:hypothetical protein
MKARLALYVTLVLICAGLTAFSRYTWHEAAAPLIAAFWGIVLVTPIIMEVIPWLYHLQREAALGKLNGKYYEFGATPIRIFYTQQQIWIATDDLHQSLGEPLTEIDWHRLQRGGRHTLIPGTRIVGISEIHLHAYIINLRSPEKQRFILWFERNVAKPIHTRQALGLPILGSSLEDSE